MSFGISDRKTTQWCMSLVGWTNRGRHYFDVVDALCPFLGVFDSTPLLTEDRPGLYRCGARARVYIRQTTSPEAISAHRLRTSGNCPAAGIHALYRDKMGIYSQVSHGLIRVVSFHFSV